jgi:hypothetical protein
MCEVLVQLFSLFLFVVALLYEGFEQGGWNLKFKTCQRSSTLPTKSGYRQYATYF